MKKSKSKLHLLAIVWGALFSSFLLLILGGKIIMTIQEDATKFFSEIPRTFITWDDPIPFFIIYMIGYIVVWWRPLWGATIMMLAGVFYVLLAGFDGPPIFALPGFLVGLFYYLWWNKHKRADVNKI